MGELSDSPVADLVTRAAGRDQEAWNEVVERYIPLVWAICVRYGLGRQGIADVSQSVWPLLAEHLEELRGEPAALPRWLAAATRRECLRVLCSVGRYDLPGRELDETGDAAIEEDLVRAERSAALRAALAELPQPCGQLLSRLASDLPQGSIGPQQARCLDRLRRSPHLARYAGAAETGVPLKIPEDEPHG
jgi:DNA-directed RNA polymerase specialized sigma24 family protein